MKRARHEPINDIEITEMSNDILLLLIKSTIMGESSLSSSSSSSSPSPKTRKKKAAVSDDELKDILVSSSLALVKSFHSEFDNTNTDNSTISRFDLLSFSDDDSRVRLAQLLGSLIYNTNTSISCMQLFHTLTKQLIDINNEINTSTTIKTKKKKFQFVVMADDDTNTVTTIVNNNSSKCNDIFDMVELLTMMTIVFMSNTNTIDDIINQKMSMFISSINSITTNNDRTSMLLQLLTYFHNKDISNILYIVNTHNNESDGNLMLSFIIMMAADLYMLQNNDNIDSSTSTNTTNILTDTVITQLTSSSRYYITSFIYFLAKNMNSNIYRTIISPINIYTLSICSASSWNAYGTLVFLLASLKGVDTATKNSLIKNDLFCENLIIACVSSSSSHENDDDDNNDNDNEDDNDGNHNDDIIMTVVNIIKIFAARLDTESLHAFIKNITISLR